MSMLSLGTKYALAFGYLLASCGYVPESIDEDPMVSAKNAEKKIKALKEKVDR